MLGSVTYYTLHANSPWTSIHNLKRQYYHLLRLHLKSLCYKSHLLCDEMTYSSSKNHMSNYTKGIIVIIDFMITCPLDHLRRYIVSILWDIMVFLLRIPIATSLHQQWTNPWGYMTTLKSHPLITTH